MRNGGANRKVMRKRQQTASSARRGLIAALDVGTAKICCFVSKIEDDGSLDVVGIGHQVARGTRAGTVVDMSARNLLEKYCRRLKIWLVIPFELLWLE